MYKISPENYQVEDFISDESFINYHFKSKKEDRIFWEEWLVNHPGKKALLQEAKETIETLSLTISEKEYREELRRITAAIDRKNTQSMLSQLSSGNNLLELYQRKKRMMQYFVPLLLILVAGGYWLFRFSESNYEKLTETVNITSLPLVLTLSDSSVVSLAPHSYLRYPLHFADKERNVYLHGDAHFNVKRNVLHPFKVHTENILATVLGTTFNIKNSGDSAVAVELLKGKLNVEIMNSKMEAEQSILLDPNEKAVYVRNAKHLYKDMIVPQNHVYFRQNNFEEIANQIKNVFGVTVINKRNNKLWRFTGEFKNTTAKDIIENICLVKNLSFVAKEDTIFIK
ncbi:MAG: FecR family protein [Ginsengibacter sp.]